LAARFPGHGNAGCKSRTQQTLDQFKPLHKAVRHESAFVFGIKAAAGRAKLDKDTMVQEVYF
jgi:hypothetical protein